MDEPELMSDVEQFRSFLRTNSALDAALGNEPREFEFLQDEEQAAWTDAYQKAADIVPKSTGRSWDSVAEEVNRAFQCALNPQQVVPWNDILPEYRLKWIFLIRQMVSIFEWASDESPIQHYEEQLVDLFREQLAALNPQTENSA
jgi:hypothetical protein